MTKRGFKHSGKYSNTAPSTAEIPCSTEKHVGPFVDGLCQGCGLIIACQCYTCVDLQGNDVPTLSRTCPVHHAEATAYYERFDRKCAEASERTKILKSQDDESLMKANLLKCYGTQVQGFRVSTEHYRYLAEQVISLREDAKLRIFHAMQASEEPPGMESLQQCICGHLRSQHSAGVWSCLERGENGWCMCTKFKGA